MSDAPFRLPPVDPSAVDDVPPASLTPELLAGLLADGDDQLAAWTLQHAMAESTRSAVYDGLLADAMRLVGENWSTGRWSVAEEHLASRTLLRTLDRMRPDLGPEGRIGPLAVLAGVAGEQHMIGLVCLEHLLAEDGWAVANLGTDLPAADLGTFVSRNEVAIVCLSALDGGRVGALADSVQAVRDARPGIPVIVGGQVAALPNLATTVAADGALPLLAARVAFARSHRRAP